MNLILVRHAVAEEREVFALKNKEDSLRPLTEKGRRKSEKMNEWLHEWVPEVDLLVTSPYTRALQTAQIVQKIQPNLKIHEASELVPHSPPSAFVKWLKVHAVAKKTVIAVGHDPQLGLLMSYLLARENQSFIELKKSGMAALEIDSLEDFEKAHARLLWLVQPRQLV